MALKDHAPIVFTLFGISTDINGLPSNAQPPMDVTLLGITTDVNLFHSNALSPIDVMLLGIVIDVSWLLEKSPSSIIVMLPGITTEVILLLLNAHVSIDLMLSGITTEVNSFPLNALNPIATILFGITTESRTIPVSQRSNARLPISTTGLPSLCLDGTITSVFAALRYPVIVHPDNESLYTNVKSLTSLISSGLIFKSVEYPFSSYDMPGSLGLPPQLIKSNTLSVPFLAS